MIISTGFNARNVESRVISMETRRPEEYLLDVTILQLLTDIRELDVGITKLKTG